MPSNEQPTVTVKVWSGERFADYDTILDEDPTEYQIKVVPEDTYLVPHDDHVVLADDMEHHGMYAFHVETDDVVELHIETNDSYHSPKEGFRQGYSIERGLVFAPAGHNRHTETPFKTEIWGRIRMRVEENNHFQFRDAAREGTK